MKRDYFGEFASAGPLTQAEVAGFQGDAADPKTRNALSGDTAEH